MGSKISKHAPSGYKLRVPQLNVLSQFEKVYKDYDVIIINSPVACHKVGQKVLLYDGSLKNIEDISVGDKLMGPDSSIRTVQKTHKGISELFTIKPKRGKEWTVTGNHILRLWRYVRKVENKIRVGKFVYEELTVSEYIKKSKDYKNNSWMQRVGVEFSKELQEPLKIPPYILGIWLGDGNSRDVGLTTIDKEIKEEWINYGQSRNCEIRISNKKLTEAKTYFLPYRKAQYNPILQDLDYYNLRRDKKHIPKPYLTASRKDRLELLAGLIDTDGHVQKGHNSIEIIQVRKRLSDDILFLCQSLGYSASQHVRIIKGVKYYRCHISGKTVSEIPVRIKYKTPENSKSNQNNYKFDIIPAEPGEFAGVTVDKDNLYLLDDFTVSHNSGKSVMAATLCKYFYKTGVSVGVPNKLLVDQYEKDFSKLMHIVRGKSSYYCSSYNVTLNKRPVNPDGTKLCSKYLDCNGCSDYRKDIIKSNRSKVVLSNFYSYVAHKLYREIFIIDEAHKVTDIIKDMNTKKLWHKKFKIPDYVKTTLELKKWLNSKDNPWIKAGNLDVIKFKKEINSSQPNFIFTYGIEKYRGKAMPCFNMVPVDLSESTPFMWPNKVKKIIMMSATISQKDLEQMGLGDKKSIFIESESPIPVTQRPVIIPKLSSGLNFKQVDMNLPRLAEHINNIAEKYPSNKGLIHLTYNLQKKLVESELLSETVKDRAIYHNKTNKTLKYNKFRSIESPAILFGCGMEEGLDLAGEDYLWQIITKVPWPSLKDPAIKFLLEKDPELYTWTAAKLVQQATGRICRGPTDYGETYVFDKSFKRLIREYSHLFPNYYLESITNEQ